MRRKLLIVDRGEFGWTLCALLPRARVIAKHYQEVTVFTPAGREWLWHGVAHKVSACHPVAGTQEFLGGSFELRDEQRLLEWTTGRHVWPSAKIAGAIVREERSWFREARFLPSLEKQWGDLVPAPFRAAELVRAACPGGAPQVCIAVRPPKLLRGSVLECKSWPEDDLHELADGLTRTGMRLALVGGSDNLDSQLAAYDLRGADLETQCAVLAAARVTVGPSSGPLHLSQLCRTPIVTWYGIDGARLGSRNRYQGSWNPWRVTAQFLDSGCPSSAEVLRATLDVAESIRVRIR